MHRQIKKLLQNRETSKIQKWIFFELFANETVTWKQATQALQSIESKLFKGLKTVVEQKQKKNKTS